MKVIGQAQIANRPLILVARISVEFQPTRFSRPAAAEGNDADKYEAPAEQYPDDGCVGCRIWTPARGARCPIYRDWSYVSSRRQGTAGGDGQELSVSYDEDELDYPEIDTGEVASARSDDPPCLLRLPLPINRGVLLLLICQRARQEKSVQRYIGGWARGHVALVG